jgi:RNA polymerase primary sigma factor
MYQDETLNCRYTEYINQFPLLTAREERKLIAILGEFKRGKQRAAARERLINCNLRLALQHTYHYRRNSSISIEDLVSAGNEGLIRAVDKFNPKRRNIRFSTFASYWIKQSILLALYEGNDRVHVPIHIMTSRRKFRKIMEQEHIDVKSAMKKMNIGENNLKRIMQAGMPVCSMDASYRSNDPSDDGLDMKNIIRDPKIEMSRDIVARRDRNHILTEAIDGLAPEERETILSRFYNEKRADYRFLGRRYKITGEAVRLRTESALLSLKKALKKKTTIRTDTDLKETFLF